MAGVDGFLRGATWGSDGTIVYATNNATTGLQRVSAAGGDPVVLTRPGREGVDHLWPEFLPGGQAVLFSIMTPAAPDEGEIAVLDLRTNTQTRCSLVWRILEAGLQAGQGRA